MYSKVKVKITKKDYAALVNFANENAATVKWMWNIDDTTSESLDGLILYL